MKWGIKKQKKHLQEKLSGLCEGRGHLVLLLVVKNGGMRLAGLQILCIYDMLVCEDVFLDLRKRIIMYLKANIERGVFA